MQNVHFTPPQLSRLFDVNVSTIKRWVDRGMLNSQKTSGGHRRISQKDLADFKKKYPKLAQKSYTLNRIIKKPQENKDLWPKYYTLLYQNKEKEARKILEKLFVSGNSILSIMEDFTIPTLAHIGQEWMRGNITIYEEHRTSFYIRQHIEYLNSLVPPAPKKSPLALLACVKGEQHELILLLLNIVLKINKWDSQVLGINVPVEELDKAIKKEKPKIVCLSKSYPLVKPDNYLKKSIDFARNKKIRLVYGGNGWTKKQKNTKYKNNKIFYISSLSSFDEYLKKI